MTYIGAHAAYVGPIMGSMVVLAFGFSLINAPSTAAIMGLLRPDHRAGAAVNETTREIGGTMGVAVVGLVFSSLFGPAVRHAFAHLGLSRSNGHRPRARPRRPSPSSPRTSGPPSAPGPRVGRRLFVH